MYGLLYIPSEKENLKNVGEARLSLTDETLDQHRKIRQM